MESAKTTCRRLERLVAHVHELHNRSTRMVQTQTSVSMVGRTVLLVDDHETVRMGVGAVRHHWDSEAHGGPRIIEADSVSSALQHQ